MKVCTHAGLSRRENRLFKPMAMPDREDPAGEGERDGDEDGLRAGAGNREFDLDRRARPDSRTYGEMDDFLRRFLRARCSFSSNSISTSFISSPTPSSGLMANPSRISFAPNTKNRIAAAKLVKRLGRRLGTACPRTAESTVITIRAENAAEKTTVRGWRIAINAATKNVLSPISENMIMVMDSMKEWKGRMTPDSSSSSEKSSKSECFVGGLMSRGSSLGTEGGTGCGIS